jgi:uncharacterized protein (DUF433 family)
VKQTINDIITVDPGIQFGKPVFKGTRVPIQSLFWHLEEGYSIDAFIAEFPSVKKNQVELFLKSEEKCVKRLTTLANYPSKNNCK